MKGTLEAQREQVLAQYDAGMRSPLALAKEYGAAQSSVRAFLRRHGRSTSRSFAVGVKDLSPTEAAYLAGLIDGEGCLFARLGRSRATTLVQAGLALGMTDRSILDEMHAMTGLGKVYTTPRVTKPRC